MKICTGCGLMYDERLNECPYCHRQNESAPAAPAAPNFAAPFDPTAPFGMGAAAPSQPAANGKEKRGKGNREKSQRPRPSLPGGNNGKLRKILVAAVACLCVVAIVVTSVLMIGENGSSKLATVSATGQTSSEIVFNDAAVVAEDEDLEKNVEDIYYAEQDGIYTILYKQLPDFFADLSEGDLFVVPPEENAKLPTFVMGFSGKVTAIGSTYVSFTVPTLEEVFDRIDISPDGVTPTQVAFIPEEGVTLDNYVPTDVRSAAAGIGNDSKITFFDKNSIDYNYKGTKKQSQLAGYQLIGKEISIKYTRDLTKDDDDDGDDGSDSDQDSQTTTQKDDQSTVDMSKHGKEKSEISAKLTLTDPAIRPNLHYDKNNPSANVFDIGFICDQKISVKYTGGGDFSLPWANKDVGKFGIVDIKDTSDLEPGRFALGAFIIGCEGSTIKNARNKASKVSFGILIQLCVTVYGELEASVELSESGFMRLDRDENNQLYLQLKNSKYPNPVLGEPDATGDVDSPDLDFAVKGNADITVGIGVDIGLCICAIIPAKLAIDVFDVEFATSGDLELSSTLYHPIKDFALKDASFTYFLQGRTQVTLRADVGLKIGTSSFSMDIGEFGYQNTLFEDVYFQFPEPVPFSLSECDFGGVQIGDAYTEQQLKDAFYQRKKDTGNSYLVGKLKDRFLQSTIDGIVNKINYDVQSLMDFLPFDGQYDLQCFSDGAIYFMDNGVVKGALITGDEVYNRSYISGLSDGTFIRRVYSEPKTQQSYKIEIGELGLLLLEKIGLDNIAQYNGTDITIYKYESDDGGHLNAFLDGDGGVIFIVVY